MGHVCAAADAQVAVFDATNSTEERRSLLVRATLIPLQAGCM